jgi:GntR family transcriptional regulator
MTIQNAVPGARIGLATATATRLRQLIVDGHFRPGSQLPSESALGEEFDVSRDTIRSAITELCTDLLLEKRRGLGTFVLDRAATPSHGLERLVGLRSAIESLGMVPDVASSKVEHYGSSSELEDAFQVAAVGPVIKITRTWTADGRPVVHSVDWVPRSILPDIHALDGLTRDESLSERLAAHGFAISAAVSWFHAVLAGEYASALGLTQRDPVLFLRQIHYAGAGRRQAVLYSCLHWNGDALRLHVVRRATS